MTDKIKLTEQGSQLSNKRKPVSNAVFLQVIKWQGLHCYWCGIKVVREVEIAVENRLLKRKWKLSYKIDGHLREEAIATIDHLQRVADDGTNDPANLVISCYPCNQARENAVKYYRYLSERRHEYCDKCGNKFILFDCQVCAVCGAEISPASSLKHFKLFNFRFSLSIIRLPNQRISIAKFVRKVTYYLKSLLNGFAGL